MKKLLLGLVGLVIALVAALLIGPSFINWNEYKSEIAAQAQAATGRRLEIAGNVSLGVLPAPALSVADVRLANAKGAATPDLLRLKSLEVRVALLPLLSGQVQVTAVKLVEPVIELEKLADGRGNWELQPAGANPGAPAAGTGGTEGADGGGFGAIRVDRVTIEKGTLIYRDTKAGTVERIENLNGRASAESLKGPLDASGSAVVRGIPLSFDTSIGAIIQGRTIPVALDLSVIPGEVKAKFNGAAVNLAEAPAIKGNLSLSGADLGGFVAALTGAAAPAEITGRRFGFSGAVTGSETAAEVKELELELDGMKARGGVSIELGKTIDAEINLAVGRIDLDKMLAATASKSAAAKPAPASKTGRATAPLAPAKSRAGGPVSLPAGINASLNVTVEALTFRKTAVRQARLSAALSHGEITLSQFSALLPRGTDIAAFGFVTLPKGEPRFEGDVEVRTNDLRGLIEDFGVEIAGIAPERLHKFSLKSDVVANADSVRAAKLDVTLDGTRVTGAATASLGARPSVTADIVVDKINLDAYLPKPAEIDDKGGAPQGSGAGGETPSTAGADPAATFGADIKARVQALTFRAIPVRELRVDAAVKDGSVTLRSVTVENAVGVAFAAKGLLTDIGGGTAAMKISDFAYDVRSNDLTQLARVLELDLPVSPSALGKVALSGTAAGSLELLDLDTKLAAAGGEFSFAGAVKPLEARAPLNGRLAVRHPDANRLIETLGLAYRPAGRLGAVNAAAKATGGPAHIDLTALDGTLGQTTIKGAVSADLSGAKPAIDANLSVGVLDVTPLLPAKKAASLAPVPRVIPAAWRGGSPAPPLGRESAATPVAGAPWSRQPLDLSALNSMDATIRLTAQSLIYQKHRLDGASIDAALRNGVLDAKKFAGTIYGGQLAATARLAAQGASGDLRTDISLANADLGQLMRARDQGDIQSGRLDFTAALAGAGRSTAELVQRLNGNGRVAITGARGGTGTFLSGFLGLMGALNQLTPFSGTQKSGATDVAGTFQIVNGVATTQDLKLASSAGNGTATARVDLPAWTIAADGEIKLAANLVSIFLVDKVGVSPALPFSITGTLDDPKYKFDIAKLPGRSIKIPGLEKLRQAPGVGEILDQLLPGQSQPAPAPAPAPAPRTSGTLPLPPPPPNQQPQQHQPQKPANVLKDILKGLKR